MYPYCSSIAVNARYFVGGLYHLRGEFPFEGVDSFRRKSALVCDVFELCVVLPVLRLQPVEY